MKYRGHTITKASSDGIVALLNGGGGYNIEGPVLTGGTGGGIAGAKRWIDASIKTKECFEKTGHAKTGPGRYGGEVCLDCGTTTKRKV